MEYYVYYINTGLYKETSGTFVENEFVTSTTIAPENFDPNTQIAYFINGVWEVITPETTPQPKYAQLTYGEYVTYNKALSDIKGWQIGLPTERSLEMSIPKALLNDVVVYPVLIDSDVQINHPELISGKTLYMKDDIQWDENAEDVITDATIDSDVIDWTLQHCEKQGVNTDILITYIAGQDVNNFPPIPNIGEWCEINRIYAYGSDKVKCLQSHNRMSFTPEETPALWLIIVTVGGEDYPVWVQPTGAHDAYQMGDRVHFPTINDPVYESLINANVWSPTVYPAGWRLI